MRSARLCRSARSWLEGAKNLEVVQLAKQLPEVRGYIEVLKKELCEDALRKRITKGLMGAASKPLQGIGHGAEQTLALSLKFDQHLNKELKTVNGAAQKLLRRNLPEGSLRARAFDVLLKTATKYEVRVDQLEHRDPPLGRVAPVGCRRLLVLELLELLLEA